MDENTQLLIENEQLKHKVRILKKQAEVPLLNWDSRQICQAGNFGMTFLYGKLAKGEGPPSLKVGRKRLFPIVDAKKWFASFGDSK